MDLTQLKSCVNLLGLPCCFYYYRHKLTRAVFAATNRNCLVSRGYSIKVADVAVCNPAYKKDYSEIGNRPPAPIRWLPWESILLVNELFFLPLWAEALFLTLYEIVPCGKKTQIFRTEIEYVFMFTWRLLYERFSMYDKSPYSTTAFKNLNRTQLNGMYWVYPNQLTNNFDCTGSILFICFFF